MNRFAVIWKFSWLLALVAGLVPACGGTAGDSGKPLDDSQVGSTQQQLCANPTLVSNVPTYHGSAGTQVTWTATASCALPNPEYRFVVGDPSNVWTEAAPYSTQSTFVWDTTGKPSGVYNWQVWIREAGSAAAYETYSGQSFTVSSVSPCTSVGAAPSPAGPVAAGTPVVINSSSTCGGGSTAEYRVLHQAPGGSWQELQAYSASAVFNWDTTGAALGSHAFQVWVRAQGSPSPYDSFTGFYFSISTSSVAACTGATLGASPPTPSAVGTSVTWTAGSATCTSPEYRFVYLPPGGVWAEAQAYSATSTFAWNTGSLAAGTYAWQVWVRQAGSTAAYDSYASYSYDLSTSAACTGATLGFAPASPSALGSAVTLTAGSATCSSPEYRFVALPPSGPWVEIRAYGASPTYAWDTNTATAGTYNWQVWVRQTGSTAAYDSFAGAPFTLTFTAAASATAKWSSGLYHSCTVRVDGTVDCWGNNGNGQLGNGTASSATPVVATGVTGATALGGGYYHNCAIVSAGAVQCWGAGTLGQLGNGGAADSNTAVSVSSLSGAVAISTGGAAHTCAALGDGSVHCWGYDSQGQLGAGVATGVSTTPVTVAGLSGAVGVSAGYYFSCALLSDGTVRCWGQNAGGQLGNGSTANSPTPVVVSGLSGVKSISSSNGFSCAVLFNGTVSCWGHGASTPVAVSGLSNVSTINVGSAHTCATLADGTIQCWGLNSSGQLGDGSTTDSATPVAVGGLSGKVASAVTAAGTSTCAVFADDTADCWGAGTLGQLGNGGVVNSSTPVLVSLP